MENREIWRLEWNQRQRQMQKHSRIIVDFLKKKCISIAANIRINDSTKIPHITRKSGVLVSVFFRFVQSFPIKTFISLGNGPASSYLANYVVFRTCWHFNIYQNDANIFLCFQWSFGVATKRTELSCRGTSKHIFHFAYSFSEPSRGPIFVKILDSFCA